MSLPPGTVCVMIDFVGVEEVVWYNDMCAQFLSLTKTLSRPDFKQFVLFFSPGAWYQEFGWNGARWRLLPTGVQLLDPNYNAVYETGWESTGGEAAMPIYRISLDQQMPQ